MTFYGRIINEKYKLIDKIAEGGMSSVWLAEDIANPQFNLAIKILKKEAILNKFENVIRFRNEAFTVSKLNITNIIKVYEIGEFEGINYIVMEYVKGNSLYKILKDGIRFSLYEILDIIYQLCEALRHMHDLNIIHRDIKSGNVLIEYSEVENKKHLKVKLIDFGISQIKDININDTEALVGTLAYISPEQIGIIKRDIDERSDLYSLGIMFYELLTGELPFEGNDINALIHQQIAKIPISPDKKNPNIPDVICKMVLKLLEKEPEKRYQSAEGIQRDIDKYRMGNMNFVLGIEDRLTRLNYRTKLIGREYEINKLKNFLIALTSTGTGVFCSISGESGNGKTRIIEEFKNHAIENGIVCLEYKCFRNDNNISYEPIKDILNLYIIRYIKYDIERKAEIQNKLRGMLGDLGGAILKLNPLMEEIIGESPPLVELEPDKEKSRFIMVAVDLLLAISKIEKGLVIILDDLQWADGASIDLVSRLSEYTGTNPMVIIGAYRTDELQGDEKGNYEILGANEGGKEAQHLFLKPFDKKNMESFVLELLLNNIYDAEDITSFIYQKSKGNPYFAIEILKHLVNENVVKRNYQEWFVDKEKLEKTDIPPNLVDILIKKNFLLNETEKEVLSDASVIGKRFDVEILFGICNISQNDILGALDRTLYLQVIQKNTILGDEIFFVHDKMREYFYFGITEQQRKIKHFKIAKAIESRVCKQTNYNIFDIAYHYIEAGDTEKILEYALPAGLEAKNVYANEDALRYLLAALYTMETEGMLGNDKWISCAENIGEVYLKIGKYDEAIGLYNKILLYLNSDFKRAKVYKQISKASFKKGDWENCEKFAKIGLKHLGEELYLGKLSLMYSITKEYIFRVIYDIFSGAISMDITAEDVEKYKEIVQFYHVLSGLYKLKDIFKSVNTSLRMLNLADKKIGKSEELAISTGIYASFILFRFSMFKKAIQYHNKAINLKEKLNDERGIAQSCQLLAFCYECIGDYNKSIEFYRKSIDIFKKVGDIGEIAVSKNGLSSVYYYLGDYYNAKEINQACFEIAVKTKDRYGRITSLEKSIKILIEEGDFDKAEEQGLELYNFAHELEHNGQNSLDYCISGILLGILYLEKKEEGKALKYLSEAKKMHENNDFIKEYTILVYPYIAEGHIMVYKKKRANLSVKEDRQLLKMIGKVCKAALIETENWKSHYGVSQRAYAKYCMLTREFKKAEKYFLQSIELGEKLDRRYELAKSYYEYGEFLREMQRMDEAVIYIEKGYNLFTIVGSKFYIKKAAKLLGIYDEVDILATEKFFKELRHKQRMSSIVSLSQDISSILNLDELLERVITIAIQVTGAHSGYLMVLNGSTNKYDIFIGKNINENEEVKDDFSTSIVNHVIEGGETILTTNAMEDEKLYTYQSVISNELKSVLCLPIKYRGKVKGACYLSNTLTEGVFTNEDIGVMNAIMNQVAISIKNAELYKKAITDGLTQLLTQNHFKYILDLEIDRAKRKNMSFSLILFDIDYFKKFNDTYGHQAGDKVLVEVAKVTKEQFRTIDTVARYGGEEFAIILPETDEYGALIAAERLRTTIENLNVIFGDLILKVTVSIGISQFPVHGENSEVLIKASDNALYTSKADGRNRVTFYPINTIANTLTTTGDDISDGI